METILVADDETSIRMLVKMTLRRRRIVEASTGDEAWLLLRQHRPDLVLLDVNMPGRSGIDVLKALRAEPSGADTRVIMLSAKAQARDIACGLAAGADHYLTKPFSPGALESLVDEILAQRCGDPETSPYATPL